MVLLTATENWKGLEYGTYCHIASICYLIPEVKSPILLPARRFRVMCWTCHRSFNHHSSSTSWWAHHKNPVHSMHFWARPQRLRLQRCKVVRTDSGCKAKYSAGWWKREICVPIRCWISFKKVPSTNPMISWIRISSDVSDRTKHFRIKMTKFD